jgi:transposase InsO family protein
MKTEQSGYSMERIATYILGSLCRTDSDNRYILVIGDYFTKWTERFPLVNMEARNVAKVLVEEVIARFGIPDLIHSDQGKQFESNLFQEICYMLEMNKTRTTAYHPKSDGMVERFNKTLLAMLTMFVDENQSNRDEMLPYCMMAYRATQHETTGMSSYIAMLAREVTTPLDISYECHLQLN